MFVCGVPVLSAFPVAAFRCKESFAAVTSAKKPTMSRAGNLLESAQASGKVYGYPLTSSCSRVLYLLRGRKRSFCTSSLLNKTSLPIINGRRCTPALSSSNCLLHTAHSLSRGSSVKFSAACALSLPARLIVGYPYKVTGLGGEFGFFKPYLFSSGLSVNPNI